MFCMEVEEQEGHEELRVDPGELLAMIWPKD